MRVVEVSTNRVPSPSPKSGAIEKYVFNISNKLANLGLEIHLISIDKVRTRIKLNGIIRHTYPKSHLLFDNLINKFLSKISLHAFDINFISTTINVCDILLDIKQEFGLPDVIHNHSLTTAVPPIIFKKMFSNDSFLVMHHHNVLTASIVNKTILKNYDLHLTVSNYVKNEVVKRFNIPFHKVHVIYNGINVNDFNYSDDKRRNLRELYGIGEDEIVLLYIGRITPIKGLHHLIEAYKIVCEKLPQRKIKLLIVGPIGKFHHTDINDLIYYNYIQKLLYLYGLYKDVKYLGYLTHREIRDIYSVSDIVVVPSIWQEPFPTTVLEALASCRPVVAYPVGGIPEILKPLNHCFLAKAVSPVELSEAIIKVISNYDNLNFKYFREYVEKKFSIECIAKRLKAIFELYVENSRRRIYA